MDTTDKNNVYSKLGFFEQNIFQYVPIQDANFIEEKTNLLKSFLQRAGFNLDNTVVDVESIQRFYWLDDNYSNALRNATFREENEQFRHWTTFTDYSLSDYYDYSYVEQQEKPNAVLEEKFYSNIMSNIDVEQYLKFNVLLNAEIDKGIITTLNHNSDEYGVYIQEGSNQGKEETYSFDEILNIVRREYLEVGTSVFVTRLQEGSKGTKGNISTIHFNRVDSGFYIYIGFLKNILGSNDAVLTFLKQISNVDSSHQPYMARQTLIDYFKVLEDKYVVIRNAVEKFGINYKESFNAVCGEELNDLGDALRAGEINDSQYKHLQDEILKKYSDENEFFSTNVITTVDDYNKAPYVIKSAIRTLYTNSLAYTQSLNPNADSYYYDTVTAITNEEKIYTLLPEDVDAIKNGRIYVFPNLAYANTIILNKNLTPTISNDDIDVLNLDAAQVGELITEIEGNSINPYKVAMDNGEYQKCYFSVANDHAVGAKQIARFQRHVTDVRLNYIVNVEPIVFTYNTTDDVYALLVDNTRLGRDISVDQFVTKERMNSSEEIICDLYNEKHRSVNNTYILYARQNIPNNKVGLDKIRNSIGWSSFDSPWRKQSDGTPYTDWYEEIEWVENPLSYKFSMNDTVFSFNILEPYPGTDNICRAITQAINGDGDTLYAVYGITCLATNDGLLYFIGNDEMTLKRVNDEAGYRFWENLGFTRFKIGAWQKPNNYYAVESTQNLAYPMDKKWSMIVDVNDTTIILNGAIDLATKTALSNSDEKYNLFDKTVEDLTTAKLRITEEPYTVEVLNAYHTAFVADIQKQLDDQYNKKDGVELENSKRINVYRVPDTNFTIGIESYNQPFFIKAYDNKGDGLTSWRNLYFDNILYSEINDDVYSYETWINTDLNKTAYRYDYRELIAKQSISDAPDDSAVLHDNYFYFTCNVNTTENFSLIVPRRWMLPKYSIISEALPDDLSTARGDIVFYKYTPSDVTATTKSSIQYWTEGNNSLCFNDAANLIESHRININQNIIEAYDNLFFTKFTDSTFYREYIGTATAKKYVVPSIVGTYTFWDLGKSVNNVLDRDYTLTFKICDGVNMSASINGNVAGQSITIPKGRWSPEELVDYINTMRRVIGGEGYIAQSNSEYADRQNVWKVEAKLMNVKGIYDTDDKYIIYFEQICENEDDTLMLDGDFLTALGCSGTGVYGIWASYTSPRCNNVWRVQDYCNWLNWRSLWKKVDETETVSYDPAEDWDVPTLVEETHYYDNRNSTDAYSILQWKTLNSKWLGVERCNKPLTFDTLETSSATSVLGEQIDLFFKFEDYTVAGSTVSFEPHKGLFYLLRDVILRHHDKKYVHGEERNYSSRITADGVTDDEKSEALSEMKYYAERSILDNIFEKKNTLTDRCFHTIKGNPRIKVKAWREGTRYGSARYGVSKYPEYYEDYVDIKMLDLDEAANLIEDEILKTQRIDNVAREISKHFQWSVNTTYNDVIKQVLKFYDFYNGQFNTWRGRAFRLGSGWDTVSVSLEGGSADINITNCESDWREPPYLPYVAYLLGWDFTGDKDFSYLDKSQLIKSLVKIYKTKGTFTGMNRLFNMLGMVTTIDELYRSFPLNGDFNLLNKENINKAQNCLYDTKPFTSVFLPDFYKNEEGRILLSDILLALGYSKDDIINDNVDFDEFIAKVREYPAIKNYLLVFANNEDYRHDGKWYLNKSNRVRLDMQMAFWQPLTDRKINTINYFVDFMKPVHVLYETKKISTPRITEKPYDVKLGKAIVENIDININAPAEDKFNYLMRLDGRVFHSRRDHLNSVDRAAKDTATKYQELRLNTCSSVVSAHELFDFSVVDDKKIKFLLHNGKQYFNVNTSVAEPAYYYKRFGIAYDASGKFRVPSKGIFYITLNNIKVEITNSDVVERGYKTAELATALYEKAIELGLTKFWFTSDETKREIIIHSLTPFTLGAFYPTTSLDYSADGENTSHFTGYVSLLNIQFNENGLYRAFATPDTFNIVLANKQTGSETSITVEMPKIVSETFLQDGVQVTYNKELYAMSDIAAYFDKQLVAYQRHYQLWSFMVIDESGAYFDFISYSDTNDVDRIELITAQSISILNNNDISRNLGCYSGQWINGVIWTAEMFSEWLLATVFNVVVNGQYAEYRNYTIDDIRTKVFNAFTHEVDNMNCSRMATIGGWSLHFEMNDMFAYMDWQSYHSRPHHSFMIDNDYNDSENTTAATLYYNNQMMYENNADNVQRVINDAVGEGNESYTMLLRPTPNANNVGDYSRISRFGKIGEDRVPYGVDSCPKEKYGINLLPNSLPLEWFVEYETNPQTRANQSWSYARLDGIPYYCKTPSFATPFYYEVKVSGDISNNEATELRELNPPLEITNSNNKLFFDIYVDNELIRDVVVFVRSGVYTNLYDLREAIQNALDVYINRPYGLSGKNVGKISAIESYSRNRHNMSDTFIKRLMLSLENNGMYKLLPKESCIIETSIATFSAHNSTNTVIQINPIQLVDMLNSGVEYKNGQSGKQIYLTYRALSDGDFIEIVANEDFTLLSYPVINNVTGSYVIPIEITSESTVIVDPQKKRLSIQMVDGVFKILPAESVGFTTNAGESCYENTSSLMETLSPQQLYNKLVMNKTATIGMEFVEHDGEYFIDIIANATNTLTLTSYTTVNKTTQCYLAEAPIVNFSKSLLYTYIFDRSISFESLGTNFTIKTDAEDGSAATLFPYLFRRYSFVRNDANFTAQSDYYVYNKDVVAIKQSNRNLFRVDGFVYDDKRWFKLWGIDDTRESMAYELRPRGFHLAQTTYPEEDGYAKLPDTTYYEEQFLVIGTSSDDGKFTIPPAEGRRLAFDIFVKNGESNFIEVYNNTPTVMRLTLFELADLMQEQFNSGVKYVDSDGDEVINGFACGMFSVTANRYTDYQGMPQAQPSIVIRSSISWSVCEEAGNPFNLSGKQYQSYADVSKSTILSPNNITGDYMIWVNRAKNNTSFPNGIPSLGGEVRPFGVLSWSSTEENALSDDNFWYYNEEETPRVGCRHEVSLIYDNRQLIGDTYQYSFKNFSFDYKTYDKQTATISTGTYTYSGEPSHKTAVEIISLIKQGLAADTNIDVSALVDIVATHRYVVVLNNAYTENTTTIIREIFYKTVQREIVDPIYKYVSQGNPIKIKTLPIRSDRGNTSIGGSGGSTTVGGGDDRFRGGAGGNPPPSAQRPVRNPGLSPVIIFPKPKPKPIIIESIEEYIKETIQQDGTIVLRKRDYQYFEIVKSTMVNCSLYRETYTYDEESEYNRVGFFRKPSYWRDYYSTLLDGESVRFDYRDLDPHFASKDFNIYDRGVAATKYDIRTKDNGRRKWWWSDFRTVEPGTDSGFNEASPITKCSYFPNSGFRIWYADNNDDPKLKLVDCVDASSSKVVKKYSSGVDYVHIKLRDTIKNFFVPHFRLNIEQVIVKDGGTTKVYPPQSVGVLRIPPNSKYTLVFKLPTTVNETDDITTNYIEIVNNHTANYREMTLEDIVLDMNLCFSAWKSANDTNKNVYFYNKGNKIINKSAANQLRVAIIDMPNIGRVIAFVKCPKDNFKIYVHESSLLNSKNNSYFEYNPPMDDGMIPSKYLKETKFNTFMMGFCCVPKYREVTIGSNDIYANTDTILEAQFLRWSLIGTKLPPYNVADKELKVCIYKSIASEKFSVPYIYTINFDRNFMTHEDICSYINVKMKAINDEAINAGIRATAITNNESQETEVLTTPLVPFVRPNRYGYIQVWSPSYFAFLESTALPYLGFEAYEEIRYSFGEFKQEKWSEMSLQQRAETYTDGLRGLEIYASPISPQAKNDRPTDLYIIKDETVFVPYKAYSVVLQSDFFRKDNTRWWNNNLNIIPRLREPYEVYTATVPFYCEYFGVEAG
jgi:hypothetical protein